ncbi:MAG: Alanyl-tRNA synthetase [Bacteroidetes bacterium]|jgi:Ser-tRNA(Ala) deacylase AlaX|nr:Alanyl-tRNA synthetase [Bacteroidota bacterium]
MKDIDPRMHTAEHLLSGTLVAMFGMGRPFTTHLEKKKSKADYRFARTLTEEEARSVEERVNALIDADLPVREEYLSREEAAAQFDLSRLPDAAGDRVRVVHCGNADACPCSGPHVASTKQCGRIRLISWSYEDGALRVRFRLEEP